MVYLVFEFQWNLNLKCLIDNKPVWGQINNGLAPMRPVLLIHIYLTGPPWWRHQMETFSALLAICAGNSPVPVNSPHKGQWRGALMFSLISAWINGWVNNREAGDLRCNRAHYHVIVMRRVDTLRRRPNSCHFGDDVSNVFSWVKCLNCD